MNMVLCSDFKSTDKEILAELKKTNRAFKDLWVKLRI